MPVKLISAAGSHDGKVRKSNQDSGYAGVQLFLVADGMGGHAGGDIASAITAQHLATIDERHATTKLASEAMVKALQQANDKLTAIVHDHHYLSGMGTTCSALMFVGDKVAVAHIGDSRIYLLRDGKVRQVTKDHTFVQKLVDAGRITAEEALFHPRRNVLMRALGDIENEPEIDTELTATKPGDRWLICSDGLNGYVPDAILLPAIEQHSDPNELVSTLIDEALEFGAPDNVTIVVVDVHDLATAPATQNAIQFLGSAANEVVILPQSSGIVGLLNPARLVQALRRASTSRDRYVVADNPLIEQILVETEGSIKSWRRRTIAIVVALLLVAGGSIGGIYLYTQSRYFIAVSDGNVAIYQGIKESFGSLGFSRLYKRTDVAVRDLDAYHRDLVLRSIAADNLAQAESKLAEVLAAVNG